MCAHLFVLYLSKYEGQGFIDKDWAEPKELRNSFFGLVQNNYTKNSSLCFPTFPFLGVEYV
jgi:hypothetical protein